MMHSAALARDVIYRWMASEFNDPNDPFVHTAYQHCVRDRLVQAYQRLCIDLVEFDNLLHLYDFAKEQPSTDPVSQ